MIYMETQPDPTKFRDYLLFFAGQQASLLGSSVAQFVIIWWITLETQSAAYLALAALAGLVPMVVLMPLAGVLVDKWNRKTVITLVDFLQAMTTVLLILLFWTGYASIWLVLLMIALRGVCQAFHSPAVGAIIPLMVPKDKLSRVNGLNYLLGGAATLVGPIVGAVLLAFAPIDLILWLDPATFLVALIPLLIIRIPPVREKQEKSSFRKDFLEGLGFIRNTRGFMTLTMLATALNFLLAPLSTLLPYYVKFDHLGDASALAFIMAFFQGGMLAGGLLMSIMKGFKKRLTASLLFVFIVFLGYGVVALTPIGLFWFMAIGAAVMGFAVAPANVLISTIFQIAVPLKMQGRVNSVLGSLSSAASPFGMLLSGAVVGFMGTANLFLICTATGLFTLMLSWLFTNVRQLDKTGEESPIQDSVSPQSKNQKESSQ
jgi:DHA3 family macrolide efflux protein-like MFS transporter